MAPAEGGVAVNQDEVYTDPEEDAAHEDLIQRREVQDTAAHDVAPKDEVSADVAHEDLEDMDFFARMDYDASPEDAG